MEWTVVTVIIALIGLVAAVITPIIKLNTIITKLATLVDGIEKTITKLGEKSDEHDNAINLHETRITVLEKGGKA